MTVSKAIVNNSPFFFIDVCLWFFVGASYNTRVVYLLYLLSYFYQFYTIVQYVQSFVRNRFYVLALEHRFEEQDSIFFLLKVWTYSLKIILYICQKLNLNFHDV